MDIDRHILVHEIVEKNVEIPVKSIRSIYILIE